MANPFLFLAPLNGTLAFQDRAGGGTLTGAGAVRYQAASGARTNLSTNPKFLTAVTGWAALNGGSISWVSDSAIGAPAARISGSGASAGAGMWQGGTAQIASSVAHTVSFDAISVSGATDWQVLFYEISANTSFTTLVANAGAVTFTAPATKQRFTATYTPTQTGTHHILAKIGRVTAVAGVIDVTNTVLETGTVTSPTYFDGSTGGVWLDPITGILGTAHASPSVSQAVAWVEEGTTNTVRNPSMETNTTDWNARGAGVVTLTRDTAYAYIGSAALKLVVDGSSGKQGSVHSAAILAASPSQAWTLTIYARGSGNIKIGIDENDSGSAYLRTSSSASLGLTDAWQRFTLSITTGASTAFLKPYFEAATAVAQTWWVDAVQLEQKAYATSYCDGAIGTGYAWSGTAHASSSTRTATTIKVDETERISSARGAVAARVNRLIDTGGNQRIVSAGDLVTVGRDYMDVMSTGSDTWIQQWITSGGAASTNTWSAANVVGTSELLVTGWNSTTQTIAVNTGTPVSSARTAPAGSMASTDDIAIGSYNASAISIFNGLIGPVAIASRPLTAKERAKLYALTSWAWGMLRSGFRHGRIV